MNEKNINYKLELFEGPLDLLLSLIEKNKIDIFDIPISFIVKQYNEYMQTLAAYDIEISADFINMAAHLLLIKSRMLLPVDKSEEDPRAELVKALLEYAQVKKIAEYLGSEYGRYSDRYQRMSDIAGYVIPEPEDNVESAALLHKLFVEVMNRLGERGKPVPVTSITNITSRRIITVSEKIIYIIRRLYSCGRMSFYELLCGETGEAPAADELVTVFIAILELIKANRVDVEGDDLADCAVILNKKRG